MEDAARAEHAATHSPEVWKKVREEMGVIYRERLIDHQAWQNWWYREAKRVEQWTAAATADCETAPC